MTAVVQEAQAETAKQRWRCAEFRNRAELRDKLKSTTMMHNFRVEHHVPEGMWKSKRRPRASVQRIWKIRLQGHLGFRGTTTRPVILSTSDIELQGYGCASIPPPSCTASRCMCTRSLKWRCSDYHGHGKPVNLEFPFCAV